MRARAPAASAAACASASAAAFASAAARASASAAACSLRLGLRPRLPPRPSLAPRPRPGPGPLPPRPPRAGRDGSGLGRRVRLGCASRPAASPRCCCRGAPRPRRLACLGLCDCSRLLLRPCAQPAQQLGLCGCRIRGRGLGGDARICLRLTSATPRRRHACASAASASASAAAAASAAPSVRPASIGTAPCGDVHRAAAGPACRRAFGGATASGTGAQLRHRPSTTFQQSAHVYCRQDRQKLKVRWNASRAVAVVRCSVSDRATANASSIDEPGSLTKWRSPRPNVPMAATAACAGSRPARTCSACRTVRRRIPSGSRSSAPRGSGPTASGGGPSEMIPVEPQSASRMPAGTPGTGQGYR